MNTHIFREYDVRGLVDKDLTDAVVEDLGRGLGTMVKRAHGSTVVVGRDARESGPRFQAAFIKGVTSTGLHVIDVGVVPTPVVYFAANTLPVDGLAVITGSHNPPEYNGFKIGVGKTTMYGEDIQKLRKLIEAKDFETSKLQGTVSAFDIHTPYHHFVSSTVKRKRPLKVVVDAGNGVGGAVAVPLLTRMGYQVVPLFCEMDGTFPNHHPDPLKEANLRDLMRLVREQGAAIGIGLDGDADRLGVVDGSGAMVFADRYMIALARHVLRAGPAPIIFDVKCSTVLRDAIRAFGGTPVMWKTGYTNGTAKMRELGAPLAGELSGHIITDIENHAFDDGIFAGCYLLKALEQSGQTLEQALADYPILPSLPEDRVHVDEAVKFKIIEHVRDTFAPSYDVSDVDGVRVDFGDGWGVVRASNTEPAITTRFEARTPARVAEIRALMLAAVEDFKQHG